jgi:hypothetical protein
MRLAEHVAYGEIRIVHKIFVCKPDGNITLCMFRRVWEDIIETDLEYGWRTSEFIGSGWLIVAGFLSMAMKRFYKWLDHC